MESRWGRSSGESRGYTYSQPTRKSSGRLEELRDQLKKLESEIQKEQERQEAEAKEEEKLLKGIAEATEKLENLRRGR